MYTYWIFSQKRVSQVFCCQEIDLKTEPTHWKVKIPRWPNIGMWGVYPEAMTCSVGELRSDFNLGERILRYSPRRPILKLHFQNMLSGALSQDTLTQIKIWVQSANIAGHCLWIDTPQAYVWLTWNFHFSMGGSRFEVDFLTAKIFWNPFLAKYIISIHKNAAKNASRFLKCMLLTFLTHPTVQQSNSHNSQGFQDPVSTTHSTARNCRILYNSLTVYQSSQPGNLGSCQYNTQHSQELQDPVQQYNSISILTAREFRILSVQHTAQPGTAGSCTAV